jgi:hypothetical protein
MVATHRAKMNLGSPASTALYLTLAATTVLLELDPATTWWFPSCPFRAVTGLLCPFCGSLRALHALLHGAPQLAFALNPLVTVGVTAAIGALAHDTARPAHATAVEHLTRLCFSARGVALVAAFGVLRNASEAAGWVLR